MRTLIKTSTSGTSCRSQTDLSGGGTFLPYWELGDYTQENRVWKFKVMESKLRLGYRSKPKDQQQSEVSLPDVRKEKGICGAGAN